VIKNNELYVNVNMDDFPLKNQTMSAVNNMFYTASLYVVSLFHKDVKNEWILVISKI
jgi:hypothetical protein